MKRKRELVNMTGIFCQKGNEKSGLTPLQKKTSLSLACQPTASLPGTGCPNIRDTLFNADISLLLQSNRTLFLSIKHGMVFIQIIAKDIQLLVDQNKN